MMPSKISYNYINRITQKIKSPIDIKINQKHLFKDFIFTFILKLLK